MGTTQRQRLCKNCEKKTLHQRTTFSGGWGCGTSADLWADLDIVESQITELERRRGAILKQIRKVPPIRDIKICMEYLNDHKTTEIAETYGITQPRVSQIVSQCMPHVVQQMKRSGGTVETPNISDY